MKKLSLTLLCLLSFIGNTFANDSFDYKYTNLSNASAGSAFVSIIALGSFAVYKTKNPNQIEGTSLLPFTFKHVVAGSAIYAGVLGTLAYLKGTKEIDKTRMIKLYKKVLLNLDAYKATKGVSPLSKETTALVNRFECATCENEHEKVMRFYEIIKSISKISVKVANQTSLDQFGPGVDLLEKLQVQEEIESILNEENTMENRALVERLLALEIVFFNSIK